MAQPWSFMWIDGEIAVVPTIAPDTLPTLVDGLYDEGLIDRPLNYTDLIGGDFVPSDYEPGMSSLLIRWGPQGVIPDERELKFIIQRAVEERQGNIYEASYAEAGSEDTEPSGLDVGFLRDPHPTLYPCMFDGEEILPDAAVKLENYILNIIDDEFYRPREWVALSIYGSGISYNWDEAGDLDIQVWIDTEKYNEIHTDEPLTGDALVERIRRLVAPKNFPRFKDLGLRTEECAGEMMIQYYVKQGKGTRDENLASKPYACLDLDNRTWLVRPKPQTPKYFGDWFLQVEPKAREIAVQAEALLGALERNRMDWMFWERLYGKHRNPRYRARADEARDEAEQDKAGIVALFEHVFKGRAKAYSPEGKGIEDERDLVQKLLEVWGIFQRLKREARTPLPWEEQELPESDDQADDGGDEQDDDADDKESHWRKVTRFVTAGWKDVMNKAQRLRQEGRVHILRNGYDHVVARVEGDHGTYTSQIWRDDPRSQSITQWDCECPWDQYAWQRTRKWKYLEGRPCSHVLALFWHSQGHPIDEERPENRPGPGQQQQLFNPETPTERGGPRRVPEPSPYGTQDREPRPPQDNWNYLRQRRRPQQPPRQPPLVNPLPPGGQPPGGQQVRGPRKPPPPGGPNQVPRFGPAAQPQVSPMVQALPNEIPPPEFAPAAFPRGQHPAPEVPPTTSRPTEPGKGGTVAIPGALSSWKVSALDPYRDAENWTECPRCGESFGWNSEDGLWGQRCACGYEFTRDDELAEMDLGPTGELWPATLPWSEEGNEYFRNAKEAAFANGTIVRVNRPVEGVDREDVTWQVPRNSKGEVLWADDKEAIVIFPLSTGKLESHLVRVQAPTSYFTEIGGSPFVRRR